MVRIHEEWDDLLIVDEDNLEDKERSANTTPFFFFLNMFIDNHIN